MKKEYKAFSTPFSKEYWQCAASEFGKTNVLVFAAIIIALRVIMKLFPLPVAENVNIYMGYLFNALGSMIYGPLMALAVGAVTDTLGVLIAPSGPYFFPFIFVEMLGSFIFAIFLYRAKLSEIRVILSKFCVNLFANIILNSALMVPFMQIFYGKSYNIFNITRIVKNLVLFPAESLLIIIFLSAMIPVLCSSGILPKSQRKLEINRKSIVFLIILFVVSLLAAAVWLELSGIWDLTTLF